MQTVTITPEIVQAAKDALVIDIGASNISGCARSLHEAAKAYLDAGYGTASANESAPVKLILHQMCHLARISTNLEPKDYCDWVAECKRIAGEE